MPSPSDPRFDYEARCLGRSTSAIAGVDEAGRGPLAGPVVAAAVILPVDWIRNRRLPSDLEGLDDSKQLSPTRREAYFEALSRRRDLRSAVSVAETEEIDRLNILRATHAAMDRALASLQPPPDHVLVDGLPVPSLPWPQTAIVKGDSLSYSIAAASILAKVTRDRLMIEFDRRWPHYGFAIHKGYPTPDHLRALSRWGPCPIHRRSFAPVRNAQPDLFER